MVAFLDSPSLPESHFAALGKVANAWADLEQGLSFCCAALIGCEPELAFCLTSQMIGPGKRLDALLALMRYRDVSQDVYKRMKALAGPIQGLGEERNRCLHDHWTAKPVLDEGLEELSPDKDKLGPFSIAGLLTGLKVPRAYAPHRFQVTARRELVHEYKRTDTSELLRLVERIDQAMENVFETVADALNELEAKLPPSSETA
jgi:hypothetical protein